MRIQSFTRLFPSLVLLSVLLACTLPIAAPLPTPTVFVLPTLTSPPPTSTLPVSTVPPVESSTTTSQPPAIPTSPPQFSPTPGVIILPGSPSGPYAVILVSPGDVLNVRAGPGAGYRVIASFPPTFTAVIRTGPSARVDNALWVEVQTPSGGTGWVNSRYLTEYVPPSAVCDQKVLDLMGKFERALMNSDGVALQNLVSPLHGLDVWLYRSGHPINFDAEHARWVFESTFVHNWGAHPASGAEIKGAFHEVVVPDLQKVFGVAHTTTCNDLSVPGWSVTWPDEYANINVVKVLKPASPNVDLDWRIWLVGVEYVAGVPYLFSMIQFIWVP